MEPCVGSVSTVWDGRGPGSSISPSFHAVFMPVYADKGPCCGLSTDTSTAGHKLHVSSSNAVFTIEHPLVHSVVHSGYNLHTCSSTAVDDAVSRNAVKAPGCCPLPVDKVSHRLGKSFGLRDSPGRIPRRLCISSTSKNQPVMGFRSYDTEALGLSMPLRRPDNDAPKPSASIETNTATKNDAKRP